METLCKLCGREHTTGECQKSKNEKESTAAYDFSQPIENFQYWNLDPTKLTERIERHEIMKKAMLARMGKDLIPVFDANPQLNEDGKLNYAVTGSYVYLLLAVADKMRVLRAQQDGALVESSEDTGLKEQTINSMGVLPGDIDVVKFNDTPLNGAVPDNFDGQYSKKTKFVEYTVGERKVIGRHPMDQFIDSWVGFTGVMGPQRMLGDIKKIRDKAYRYESILKSLLQSIDIEELANRIVELYLEHRLESRYGELLLIKPEAMREHFEQKGTKHAFEMDPKNFSALLTLMKTVAEVAKQKLLTQTATTTEASSTPKLDTVKYRLRNPEIRTPATEVILKRARAYFEQIFSQKNAPEFIQQFKDRKGVILCIGSLLRGTARGETSDFDVVLFYDDAEKPPLDGPTGHHLVEQIVTQSEQYHPDHISFSTYLARQLKDDPVTAHWYEARRAKFEQTQRRPLSDAQVEKYFILSDPITVEMERFSEATVAGGSVPPNERYRDKNDYLEELGITAPQLLTATSEFAIESTPGALRYHQHKVVKSFAQLESINPTAFRSLYDEIVKDFRGATLHEGGSHGVGKAYYDRILREHVEKSGRFAPEQVDRATKKLRAVKRQIEFPSFEELKRAYLDI